MNAFIRPMTREDVERVYELEKIIFDDFWSKQSFIAELDNFDVSRSIVLDCENQIAGYAVLWYYAQELHIANFAIAPEFRRQGYGQQMLDYILNIEDEYRCIFLEVRAGNHAAIGLYKKSGFSELYKRERYYRNGENALVMVYENKNFIKE